MIEKVILLCKCQQRLHVPFGLGTLVLTCPTCSRRWSFEPGSVDGKMLPSQDDEAEAFGAVFSVRVLSREDTIPQPEAKLDAKAHTSEKVFVADLPNDDMCKTAVIHRAYMVGARANQRLAAGDTVLVRWLDEFVNDAEDRWGDKERSKFFVATRQHLRNLRVTYI